MVDCCCVFIISVFHFAYLFGLSGWGGDFKKGRREGMMSCGRLLCASPLLPVLQYSGEFPIVEVAVPVNGCALEHDVNLQ